MSKTDLEKSIDKKLKIQTTGRDDSKEDTYHHPYEPTPYSVLTRLVESEYLTKENIVVDYGCGKGRVDFFLSAKIGCKTIGVDFDERMINKALENNKSFSGKKKTEFVCISAENYEITDADCFYFFNPFPIEILHSVLGKILDSYYENPRSMTLFFYYPDEEYVAYLMTKNELMFVDEIEFMDLFEGENERERILIFEIV
ncbi:MAG: class I SAM-dependent methyltransferase [Lachnospiraceae bacterium]|nr:class I SAM-dependent methyltransferase [Lachnospiraceae bacterium]